MAGSSRGSGKRFEIKKWNAVAMWSWAICTDTCAICRNNLYEASIEYQANPNGALLGLVLGCATVPLKPNTLAWRSVRYSQGTYLASVESTEPLLPFRKNKGLKG